VTTDFAGNNDWAYAVAIQGDGKIVAAGRADLPGYDFALVRYNIDGSPDTTFSGDGKITTDFAGSTDGARAVAIQADGKIIAAGLTWPSTNYDFALARYNIDGSLDGTFGGDGRVTTDFAGGPDQAFAVAVQGDGKIVTAGLARSASTDFALARYNSDGSLDPTFDGDGLVTTDFSGAEDQANAFAIQADGKIVTAGHAVVAGTNEFALARYNTDASLDPTFSGDGRVTTGFAPPFVEATAVAIQEDGRIVTVGFAGSFDFALARHNTDGSLDATFSGDGTVTTSFFGGSDRAFGMAIQGDGKIVVAGDASPPHLAGDFALARYNSDGSLDAGFGGDGRVTIDFAGNNDEALAMAIQADGKILAAGLADVSGNQDDFALARHDPDGGSPTCAGKRATTIGTRGADILTGTSQKDVIMGLGGRDLIRTDGGSDIVCAGPGNDRVAGGRGNDRVLGGRGNDRLLGGPGADRLIGGLGRDRLIGGAGSDQLLGGPGKDSQQQ
jgi:uncharacterized delta-60 repeat protein